MNEEEYCIEKERIRQEEEADRLAYYEEEARKEYDRAQNASTG